MLVWSVFSFTYIFVIIVIFSYIYISQGSVETHLPSGGIYNNHIIGHCFAECASEKILKIGL